MVTRLGANPTAFLLIPFLRLPPYIHFNATKHYSLWCEMSAHSEHHGLHIKISRFWLSQQLVLILKFPVMDIRKWFCAWHVLGNTQTESSTLPTIITRYCSLRSLSILIDGTWFIRAAFPFLLWSQEMGRFLESLKCRAVYQTWNLNA